MKIKEVYVRTIKNHVESEIFLDKDETDTDCYVSQVVYPVSDSTSFVCAMTTGIPSDHVLTCADAVPAVPSTEKKSFPYCLETKLLDSSDKVIDEKSVTFEFSIPDDKKKSKRNGFFSFFSGKENQV